MANNARPTKVNSYNVYFGEKATQFLGISEEVTLPDWEALTEALNGAGILGEIDEPIVGRFGANEIEIPFREYDKQMYKIASMTEAVSLTLRISRQAIEKATGVTDFLPTRIVIKGKNKGFASGSVKAGAGSAPSMKVEIFYYLLEISGEKVFELDKLNFVYKVNGKDLLKKVKKQI